VKLNKGEAIRRLKEKMKVHCNKCAKSNISDIDYCFNKCWIHIFTNLMIKEIGED
jgi:hypothetical protein